MQPNQTLPPAVSTDSPLSWSACLLACLASLPLCSVCKINNREKKVFLMVLGDFLAFGGVNTGTLKKTHCNGHRWCFRKSTQFYRYTHVLLLLLSVLFTKFLKVFLCPLRWAVQFSKRRFRFVMRKSEEGLNSNYFRTHAFLLSPLVLTQTASCPLNDLSFRRWLGRQARVGGSNEAEMSDKSSSLGRGKFDTAWERRGVKLLHSPIFTLPESLNSEICCSSLRVGPKWLWPLALKGVFFRLRRPHGNWTVQYMVAPPSQLDAGAHKTTSRMLLRSPTFGRLTDCRPLG